MDVPCYAGEFKHQIPSHFLPSNKWSIACAKSQLPYVIMFIEIALGLAQPQKLTFTLYKEYFDHIYVT